MSADRAIAMVAQGLPWSPTGSTVFATVMAQWTLLVYQRKHNGGTREAEGPIVKLTTTSAANDDNCIKMTTFSFQCYDLLDLAGISGGDSSPCLDGIFATSSRNNAVAV